MKKRYRIKEVMDYGAEVQYQVESSRWWWPFWLNEGGYWNLEHALKAISEAQERDKFKRKVIYKSG